MRVVVDTNVFIKHMLSSKGNASRIFTLARKERFELVASEPILAEYQKVLHYPHIQARYHIEDDVIEAAITALRQGVILVTPTQALDIVKDDQKDNMVFECAVAGKAAYIVSDDEHLLNI